VARKGFGVAQVVRDESKRSRFYAARYWKDASCAERCHADADVRGVTSRIYLIARVSHIVNGATRADPLRLIMDERRLRVEADRRTGIERRVSNGSSPTGIERRTGFDRRLGPRRLSERPHSADLVAAARQAREHAHAPFSRFKVGAALETADGRIITGVNIENASYGLTLCAERVAIFKAISDGHRAFTRIAVVADTADPTPPCGACRQILWEFGGDLEVILANLTHQKGSYRMKDLLPLPFDQRLL
jgi:cytidine deaminase